MPFATCCRPPRSLRLHTSVRRRTSLGLTAAAIAALVGGHGVVRAQGGALSFTDITAAAGMASSTTGSHGVFWADATGDGLPDLFISYNECRTGLRANRFYRNVGGAFVEEARARGLYVLSGGTHGAAWADVDNDGDYDLLNGNTYAEECPVLDPPGLANRIYRNDGGVFVDRTPPDMAAFHEDPVAGGGYTRSILGFDLEGDGDLDVFAVNGDRGSGELVPDHNELYRNLGGGAFSAIRSGTLVTTPAGQGATDTDYDGDGDIDILVSDFGGFCDGCGDLGVLRNDGQGVFTRVSPTSIGITHKASSGIAAGDLNNDGLIDLVLIDQDRNPFRHLGFDRIVSIYLNAGAGRFNFVMEIREVPGFSAGLADLDNDGDLDLVLPGVPVVGLNDGQGHFSAGPAYPTPRPNPACVGNDCTRPDPRTVAFADIDDDGDLDFVVTAKYGAPTLIRNNLNGGKWLKVQLTSPQGQAGAFGAKVRVLRAGTNDLIAFREARSGYGYLAQDEPVLHVGLGSASVVDVDVRYLDGTHDVYRSVQANQTIALTGGASLDRPQAPRDFRATVNGALVSLAWNAPAGGPAPASYRIEAGSAPGLADLAVLPVGADTFATATAPNGVYYVRVRARSSAGFSDPSNEIVVTVGGTCAVPAAPVNLSFSLSGRLVSLSWSGPAGGPPPLTYIVEAGASPGAADLAVIDSGGTSPTFMADAPPGRYYVRVRGRNACGVGAGSGERVIDVP